MTVDINSSTGSFEIAAYVTLEKERALNGNPLILVARDTSEQKQMAWDIARAIRADVVQLRCGDYIVISK